MEKEYAYRKLILKALSLGYSVSVWDGEAWQLKASRSLFDITEAADSVDHAELRFSEANGNGAGWALVSRFDLLPDETVIDHTCTPWIEEFMATIA